MNNKLTDEKIKARINAIEDRRSASRDFWDGDWDYPEDIELLALREVLERRKASKEPVRYLNKFSGTCVTLEQQPNAADDVAVYIPLYAAPPAPVVPKTLPCSVELKPGLIIGKGCKTETLLTALRRRAEYYAKLEAMTPEERAKHGASIEAFKTMLPQPAPVDKEFIPKNLDKALGVVGVALPESKEEFNFQIERWIQRLIDRVIRYADEFKEPVVPVVPEEMNFSTACNFVQINGMAKEDRATLAMRAWNACRAAMLNGGKS